MQEKYTIYMLFREITKLNFSRAFPLTQKYGIHPGQLPIFRVLANEGCMAQGELAKILRITPATMTTSLNRLEASGFIAKQKDSSDKRRTVIALTPTGMKLSQDIATMVHDLELSFTKGFSKEELTHLETYLQQIKENLLQESSTDDTLHIHCLPKNYNK